MEPVHTDQKCSMVFFHCPQCGEESAVTVAPGWNKLDCPYCSYYLIVYQDQAAHLWTRTPGVLESGD